MKFTLNQMVESPQGRWQFRILQMLLIFSSGLLLWLTAEKTPQFKAKHEELRKLFSLEQRVAGLRLTVTDSTMANSQLEASKGVFRDWREVALWLEQIRQEALDRDLFLSYSIDDEPISYPNVNGIQSFPLTIQLGDEQKDFAALVRYLRDGIYRADHYLDTESFRVVADSLGVTEMSLQVNGWLLQ